MGLEFEVLVRNEHTGEHITVVVPSFGPQDAQVKALTQVFRGQGWRKCLAFVPVSTVPIRLDVAIPDIRIGARTSTD